MKKEMKHCQIVLDDVIVLLVYRQSSNYTQKCITVPDLHQKGD